MIVSDEERNCCVRVVTDGKVKKQMRMYQRMWFYITSELIRKIVRVDEGDEYRGVIAAKEANEYFSILYQSNQVDFIVNMDGWWYCSSSMLND